MQQPLSAFQGYYSVGLDTLIDGYQIYGAYEGRDSLYLFVEEGPGILLGYKDSTMNDQRVYRNYPTFHPQRNFHIRKNRHGIIIHYQSTSTAGNMVLGFDRVYCRLSMLTDGSMLIKKGEWYLGLVLLVFPVYGSEYEWVRITPTNIHVVSKESKTGKHP